MRSTILILLFEIIVNCITNAQHRQITTAIRVGNFLSIPRVSQQENSEFDVQLGLDISRKIRKKKWTPFSTSFFGMPSIAYSKKESTLPDKDYFYAYNFFMPFGVRQMWSTKIMNGHKTGLTIFGDAGLRLRYTINAYLRTKMYPPQNLPGTIVLDPGLTNAVYEFRGNPIINEDRFGINSAFGLGARYRRMEIYFGMYFPIGNEINNKPVLLRNGLQSDFYSWIQKNNFNDKVLCVGYYF